MFEIDPELEAYIRDTYPPKRAEELLQSIEYQLSPLAIINPCLATVRIFFGNHPLLQYVDRVRNFEKVEIFAKSILPTLRLSQKEKFQLIEAMLAVFSIGIDAKSPRDWEYAALKVEKQVKNQKSRSAGGKKSAPKRQNPMNNRQEQIHAAVLRMPNKGSRFSIPEIIRRLPESIPAMSQRTLYDDIQKMRNDGRIPPKE